MCGICGKIHLDGRSLGEHELEDLITGLRHRGPDGSGSYVGDGVALGHTRLAIIDIDGGTQPMKNTDGSIVLVYNGEIYNYRELRDELSSLGHSFRTNSDTEVLLVAFEEWGAECVTRLRGMFAFAALNRRANELVLARDHFGMKPLFYAQIGSELLFSSELTPLAQTLGSQISVDTASLEEFLRVRFVPAPRTIYKEIRKLPAAHTLTVPLAGPLPEPAHYWAPDFPEEEEMSFADACERFHDVFSASVRAHLVSDVPFGAFLSGGLDSSAVVALMSGELQSQVRTYTIGFAEERYSELPYAEQVAERIGTEHHPAVISPSAVAVLPDIVQHFGEPFGDWSVLPTYYLAKHASAHVKMVLGGDGGDEMLGGYESYKSWISLFEPYRPGWRRLLLGLMNALGLRSGENSPWGLDHWFTFMQAIDPETRRCLLRPEYHELISHSIPVYDESYSGAEGSSPLRTAQRLDLPTHLAEDILTKVDRMSMAHGLEVRSPFLDIEVFRALQSIPSRHLYRREGAALKTRLPLRETLARYYPKSLFERPKAGFNIPLNEWFLPGSELRTLADELFVHSEPLCGDYLDTQEIRTRLNQHTSAPTQGILLWQLLVLELWFREGNLG